MKKIQWNWATWVAVVLWLLAAAVFGWVLYLFLTGTGTEFKVGTVVALISVGASIFQYRSAKQREIDALHFEHKRAAYEELSKVWFKLITSGKQGKKRMSEQELQKSMFLFKEKLVIWGNLEMIRAWRKFESLAQTRNEEVLAQSRNEEVLAAWHQLWAEIRNDLGHFDSDIEDLEFAAFFLVRDEAQKLIETGTVDSEA